MFIVEFRIWSLLMLKLPAVAKSAVGGELVITAYCYCMQCMSCLVSMSELVRSIMVAKSTCKSTRVYQMESKQINRPSLGGKLAEWCTSTSFSHSPLHLQRSLGKYLPPYLDRASRRYLGHRNSFETVDPTRQYHVCARQLQCALMGSWRRLVSLSSQLQ